MIGGPIRVSSYSIYPSLDKKVVGLLQFFGISYLTFLRSSVHSPLPFLCSLLWIKKVWTVQFFKIYIHGRISILIRSLIASFCSCSRLWIKKFVVVQFLEYLVLEASRVLGLRVPLGYHRCSLLVDPISLWFSHQMSFSLRSHCISYLVSLELYDSFVSHSLCEWSSTCKTSRMVVSCIHSLSGKTSIVEYIVV